MIISMTSSMSKKALWLAPLSAAILMLAACNNSSTPADNTDTAAASDAHYI